MVNGLVLLILVLLIFSKRGIVLKSMAQLKGMWLVYVLVYSSASVE